MKPRRLAGVLFWLAVWQITAMLIGNSIILVTPLAALRCLAGLCLEADFYRTLLNSFLRIGGGFFTGVLLGILGAVLSGSFRWAETLIDPIISAVRSVPVASFVIFALFFMKSSALSYLISCLMVLPVIYEAVLKGITNADKKLCEAADIFALSPLKKARYLYFPSVMPFLTAAFRTASGLAFKSGTAAEVIGQPDFTLGDMLYRAKIYLETEELFAWTITIICLGKLFEQLAVLLLKAVYRSSQRIGAFKGGVCSDD